MVSIVIPAYNEEKNIGKCLEAFLRQKTKHKFEIILVDNNSRDRTIEIASQFKKKLHIKIIHEMQKGRGAARKKGFNQAKGEIILSTDADTIVPLDWIEKLTLPFKDEKIIAVTGTAKIDDCSQFINSLYNQSQPLLMKGYKTIFGYYWLHGFNFAIRKSTYKRSKGFNKKLNGQEDLDLGYKIKNYGKVKLAEEITVQSSGRRFKKHPMKGAFMYLKSFSEYWLKQNSVYLSDIR